MKFRTIAREAVIFMLVSAVIGSIGYTTLAYRAYRPVTASFSKAEPDKYVIACPDTEVPVGSKSSGDNSTEELCVPSNFPTLSPDEQIKILSRDSDFAQLPKIEQLKVIIVFVSRFYDEKTQRAGVAPAPQTPRDSRVILYAAIIGFLGGFPAGLVVWLLYRLARFAVKG
jgi:hypothetical protein